MTFLKKWNALLLVLVLLACPVAGGAQDSNPLMGTWRTASCAMAGVEVPLEEVFETGLTLTLNADGTCALDVDGEEGMGNWEATETGLALVIDGMEITALMQGQTMLLENLFDSGLDLTLAQEGGEAADLGGDSAEVAYYPLEYASENGETMSGDVLRSMGFDYYLLLARDSSVVFQTDNRVAGTWEDGMMTLWGEDGTVEELPFTLEGDTLTIESEGLTMVFQRSDGMPENPAEGEEGTGDENSPEHVNLSPLQQWWQGDWYGYWTVSGTTSAFEDLDDQRMDCFATIDVRTDDFASIHLWDNEGMSITAEVSISGAGGSGAMGAAVSESGQYWDGAQIGHADWIIDPSLYAFEDYMVIDGYYESAEDPDEGFYYWVHLRPWGMTWDDIPQEEWPPQYEWYTAQTGMPMQDVLALSADGGGLQQPDEGVDGAATGQTKADETTAPADHRIRVSCPAGWTLYEIQDFWAEEEGAIDPDAWELRKGAVTDIDRYLTPGMTIHYYDEDDFQMTPSKDFYEEGKNLPPLEIGGRTWQVIGATSFEEAIAVLWIQEDGKQVEVKVELENGDKTISLEDEDVLEIIASITY